MATKHLTKAVPLEDIRSGHLWVVYGKSGSGKTHFLSTFPKPMLYIQFGDDGHNTLRGTEGIDVLQVSSMLQLEEVAEEVYSNNHYRSIAVDTFSLCVQEWTDANAAKKNKRMSQQMWGDLATDTCELIKGFKQASHNKEIVLTCHEIIDTIEGMEEEITPDVRPNVSKSVRSYLESMANYGIHMTVLQREKQKEDGSIEIQTGHAAHLAPNPYYWTKLQKPASVKAPRQMINPTYTKIMKIMEGN